MKKLILLVLIAFAWQAEAQTAIDILKKHDEITFAAKDQKAELTITLTDKKGNVSTRKAVMYQKGMNKRLTRFTYPEAQAGIGFLSLPNDVMYVYLPAFGKERRIASHVKNQTFAGTDFSYDDMEAVPSIEKYNPKLIKTTETEFVLEMIPKKPETSEYSKVIIYINRTTYCSTKTEYFNKGGIKIKELIHKFEKKGNFWYAASAEMTDLRNGHKTRMTMTNITFDSNLSDDIFTVKNLVNI